MKNAAYTVFAALGLLLAASPASAQQWQWNGRIDNGRAIEIKAINGAIRAVAGSGNEVRVTATKSARRNNPDSVTFEVVQHAGGVTICAMYPARRGSNECRNGEGGRMSVQNNDVTVEWVVQVPRGVDFIGRTVNGDIEISSTPANAHAVTINGDIRISTGGIARAFTVNGNIDATMGRADWTGAVKLETTNGYVAATLPGDFSAEVTASTVNGDIDTEFPLEVRGRFGPKRISGTIGGGGGRSLALSTVNGDVKLRRR